MLQISKECESMKQSTKFIHIFELIIEMIENKKYYDAKKMAELGLDTAHMIRSREQ